MKKVYLFLLLPAAAVFMATPALTNSSAGPSGRTGSPGDNGVSCANGCHTGGTVTDQMADVDVSGIPASGYIPGQTYDITVSGDRGSFGGPRIGFSFTAERASDDSKVGGFMSGAGTQVNGNGQSHITHTSSSITASGNSNSWTFQWTAPASGTGDVNFYAVLLFANGNGGNSGDIVLPMGAVTVSEDLTVGLTEDVLQAKFYPLPARDYTRLSFDQQTDWLNVRMYNSSGQFVQQLWYSDQKGSHDVRLELSDVANGTYWVEFSSEQGSLMKPLLVQ
ncbi:T9SS type A sorting domain-containing protein [Cryomorphaceae bacterium]|nr:T9SS type A sorting domain-containing protein [Cryomorphaceae bacterium]